MFVKVDVLSQFKMTYVVELKDGDPMEYALDTVAMDEDKLKEFSQHHLGTTIFSATKIEKESIVDLAREENEYLKSWSDDKLMSVLVNTLEEDTNGNA